MHAVFPNRNLPLVSGAVTETRAVLAAQGHTLVEWNVKGENLGRESMELFAQLLGADGAKTLIKKQLKNQGIDPILKELVFLLGMNRILRWIIVGVHYLMGWSRIARIVSKGGAKTTVPRGKA